MITGQIKNIGGKFMDKLYEQSETGCCPRFDPKPWEEKEVSFKDKLFLKDHVRSILHIPLNFDKIMVKNMERIRPQMPFHLNRLCSQMKNHCGELMSILR